MWNRIRKVIKATFILPEKVWYGLLWPQQTAPNDAEAAQPWARWSWFGYH